MDTLLENGDWALDACGIPIAITGWQEELQRCRIRLQTPRGAFLHQPTLGSGLCALARQGGEAGEDQRALELAQEALLPLPHIRVRAAKRLCGENGLCTGFLIQLAGEGWQREVTIHAGG